ncbi:hypothetical protein [Sphingomonas colocasiae]|uniref:Uncharacterized protein n=1 Tax=Sphingomonas colocasiae TaxID=1848973 RepID=A0ABS7PPZ8_9SPHN|nr:hypothetical protein [Sphingomonas colocasiae]MBY8822795.1 hypothetical protein [Sphingomonas colocasiae]
MIDALSRLLDRYAGFGRKASGGAGDDACGAWLEAEMAAIGFATERRYFDMSWFDADRADLSVAGLSVPLLPHLDWSGTVAGRMLPCWPDMAVQNVADRIVLLHLPFERWSDSADRRIARQVDPLLGRGAAAIILVTTGPTGQPLALNIGDGDVAPLPAAIMGSRDAAAISAMAGAEAVLTVQGRGGRRPAYNLVARLDRGHARDLVVSTPRSGWFDCVGERGPGIAIWRMLAEALARDDPGANLVFVCASGHERGYAGMSAYLSDGAPSIDRTAFWLHLGANCAARDWHRSDEWLMPLPSADPHRFLVASPAHVEVARPYFAGLSGLECPYPGDGAAAGETGRIMAAGYPDVAGIFGGHLLHHCADDDLRAIDVRLVRPVLDACEAFLRRALA